ncbi:MAG: cysteine desulfurase, partial [Flavobacteriales bacterium]|nr:cysteine desulfurase [Flavobacteriales bacterium]
MKKIYFDNAATTEISKKVISEMMKAMKVNYGNPSSTHSHGRNSKAILELSRKTIAEKFNVNPKEIIFTSGGTESNNMIIKAVVTAQNIERIISTKIEHKAVLNSIESIAKERDIKILFLDVDEFGLPNKQQLIEYLENSNKKTLVSLMHINNETGTMIDLEEFGKICKSNNSLFHSDTVQTIGHYNIDLHKINIDFITCSAHKFHGPKGVGFAYIKNGQTVKPFIEGGAQE